MSPPSISSSTKQGCSKLFPLPAFKTGREQCKFQVKGKEALIRELKDEDREP